MDALPISWSDMRAYFDLIGVDPQPWELRAIATLDFEYLKTRANGKPAVVVDGAKALAGAMKRE